VTAFNLTSATFIPAWGQVADIFGRYGALQVAITCMLIGSALCTGAPVTAFPMLLFGRALLGMGCAGLNIVIKTVLADKVSLEENAKNNTIFTLVAGIGYGIGPTIGGYLTSVSWRWVFIINIPLGLIGMVGTHFLLRSELLGPKPIIRSDGMEDDRPATFLRRVATIDVGGQFFFLFGMGLLILAVTWGGSYYSWTDVKVLAPLIVGGILLVSFMIWEYFMAPGNYLANRFPYRKAMIPLSVLTTRNAGIIIYLNYITGMGMLNHPTSAKLCLLTLFTSYVRCILLCRPLFQHSSPIWSREVRYQYNLLSPWP
jgi:MFS family permease